MRRGSSRVLSQGGGCCAGDTAHAWVQRGHTALDNRGRYRARGKLLSYTSVGAELEAIEASTTITTVLDAVVGVDGSEGHG